MSARFHYPSHGGGTAHSPQKPLSRDAIPRPAWLPCGCRPRFRAKKRGPMEPTTRPARLRAAVCAGGGPPSDGLARQCGGVRAALRGPAPQHRGPAVGAGAAAAQAGGAGPGCAECFADRSTPRGSFFDPGGAGKGAVTVGGKLFMMVHWFFMAIVAASYTASVVTFLATAAQARPPRFAPATRPAAPAHAPSSCTAHAHAIQLVFRRVRAHPHAFPFANTREPMRGRKKSAVPGPGPAPPPRPFVQEGGGRVCDTG